MPSHAATYTWDADGTTGSVTDGAGSWLGAGQWWDGSTNVTWASGNDAVFGVGGTGGAVTLSATTSANSLTFNSFGGTYTIGTAGQTLTLGSGGLTMNSSAGAVTLLSPVAFSAAQTWTNNATSLLTGSGAIDNGGFLFTAAGTGSTTLAGAISGLGGLTKSGAGVLTLSNTANTYSGVTTITGGTLQVAQLANGGANSSIGAASSAAANLVINGGVLRYTGATAQSTNRLVTVGLNGATFDSSGSATVVFSSTGSLAYSGSGDRTITFAGSYAGGNNQLGAVIADSGGKTSVVKTGTGTWMLGVSGGASNTYTGSTAILAGTLIGGAANGLQGFGNTSAIYLGNTSGTSSATVQFGTGVATAFNSVPIVVQSGNSGTATIVNNTNNTINGTVTLGSPNSSGKSVVIRNIGDYRWGPNFNSVIQDPAGLVAGTAGTVIFDNADVNGDSAGWRIAGANTYSGDTRLLSGSITISNSAALQNSTLDLGFAGDTGSVVWNQNSTLGGLKGTRNLDTNGRTLSIGNNGQSTTYSGVLSGSGGLAKIGLGTLSLAGTNTYTGATSVSAGTLLAGGTAAFGNAAGTIVASGGVLDLGGYAITRSGTVSFTGGTVQSGTLTNDTVAFDGQSGTVSASLAGAAGLTKSGAGTLSLTGSNSYAGGTVVNAGALAVATKDALPGWNVADKLTVNSGGGVAVGNAFADADVATMIATGSNFRAGAAIGFDTTAGDRTYATNLADSPQGGLGLTKTGANTLTLSVSNSYTGPTRINAGVLSISSTSALQSSTLDMNAADSGTVTFGQNSTLGGLTGSRNLSNGGYTLSIGNNNTSTTYSGTLSGVGGLTKLGAGVLTLSNTASTYSGVTTITGGTLQVAQLANGGVNSSIGAASSAAANLVINGGVLRYAGSTAQSTDRLVTVGLNGATFDSSGSATVVISSTGGLVAYSGSGDRTITFAGSYAGGNNQFGAVIADSGGKTSVVKTGTGTWLLGQSGGVNNTYTGSTTILAGTLIGGATNLQQGFGNTSAIYLGDTSGTSSATVQFGTGVGTVFNSVSIIVQTGNSGTATIVSVTNQPNGIRGTVTLGSANSSGKSVVIRNIGNQAWTPGFNSVIQDPAGLVAGTAGTVIFDNADVGGDSANWSIAGANTYSGDTRLLSGSITISNAAALQNSTLDLGFAGDTGAVVWGQNSTLGGLKGTRNLDTNGRTLSIGNNGQSTTYSGVLSGSGGLAKIGLGTLSLAGTNTYTGATSVSAGTLLAGGTAAFGNAAGTIVASGGVLDLGGYAITRSGTVSFTGGTVQSGTLTNDTIAFDAQSGSVSASLAGAAGLTKSGAGTLALTGSNSYTGGTVVNAGVLAVATKNALPGWNVADKLTVNSGGGVAVGADFADADVATMIATGSNFRAGAAIGFDTTAGNRTYSANLVNSAQGALGLTKSGPNTLTVSGSNSYTGPTLISGGTVAFTFAGNQSLSGTISGAGSLAKSGAGTLTLSVAPTLTGTVTVSAGKLQLPAMNSGMPFTAIIDSGTLDTSNGGTWGNNTVRFGSNGGTLNWGGGNWFGSGAMNVISTAGAPTSQMIGTTYLNLNSGTVNFTANGDINLNSPIANTGSIIKGGTGTLILAANAFSGSSPFNTFVDAGTVRVNANDALSGTGAITFRGGVLQYNTASPTDWSSKIRNSGSAIAVDTTGRSITWSGTINSTNTGGLTKLGSGTLALNGTNAFTGATAISAGILSINGTNALQGTSGVGIAGGAGLRYTGGSAEFAKNVTVTAGSGTGTIENTGGGVLTLAGTLSKDNSVLRLTGGSFNVTGLITGTTVGTSDLVVDAALVTLSNTNSYSGPTFVYNSGTLMLGVSNAIPSNSVVSLGNSTSGGTFDLNGATNAIGGLAFGSGGGTLRVAATSTSTAPLTASTGTMTLTNGTLDLAGSGSTAGLYRVLSAQSIAGAFASVTGTSAAYQVLTTATSVDYQQRAVLGTVSVTNPAAAIITGGSAAFSYSVANTALSGGATLSFTGTGLSNVAGPSNGSASAAGTSSSVAGLLFTGTSIGFGQTGTFAVSDPNAFGSTSVTGTVTATVFDHATSSLASSLLTSTTISLGTYNYATQTWESGTNSAAFQIFNIASVFGAELTADLSLLSETGAGDGFTSNLNTYVDIVGGTSSQFSVFFDPTGLNSSATKSTTFTLATGDKTGMSGATSSNTLFVTAEVIVVPEPGAIVLAGVGLLAVLWRFKRDRSVQI